MEEITDPNCIVKAFENKHITILNDENKYYFRGSDVAKALGISNVRSSIQNFTDKEKGVRRVDTLGGPQDIIFLSSHGVYRLLYASKKKVAEEFREWVGDILDDIIFNNSKDLKKQLEENEAKLQLLQKENTEKQTTINSLKKKKLEKFMKKEALYIATDKPDRCVIGISVNMNDREKNYVIHNPDLKIYDIYYCRDYKLTESIIKKIMSKYVYHDRSNEWFNCGPEKVKNIVEVVIHLLDNEYNDLDDLQTTFNNLHNHLNIDKESIQTTAVNVFYGESIYKTFIETCCEIGENNKETGKNILLAFKDYIQETSEFEYYDDKNKNNNSYGFNQAFQKEFYKNVSKILKVELSEFRINTKTISGFKTIKIKDKDDLNTTELKNDFSEEIYQDFLDTSVIYSNDNDKRGQIKIKTVDIVTHFIGYLSKNGIVFKETLINDNIFRTKLVKVICNKFDTKERARLSFNGDSNRNRNKGFYGISLVLN